MREGTDVNEFVSRTKLPVGEAETTVRRPSREEAESASPPAVRKLAELALARDLARVWKELGGLARHLPTTPKQAASFPSALQQMSAKLQPPTFEEGFTKITNVRVKKKESDDATPVAEVVNLSASASELVPEAAHDTPAESPEEIGVATEAVE